MATSNEKTEEKEEKPSSRQRLQLDFSSEAYQRLEELRKKADARSNADVVRNAIRLYEWFLEQKRGEFNRIQVSDGKTVKEIEIIF